MTTAFREATTLLCWRLRVWDYFASSFSTSGSLFQLTSLSSFRLYYGRLSSVVDFSSSEQTASGLFVKVRMGDYKEYEDGFHLEFGNILLGKGEKERGRDSQANIRAGSGTKFWCPAQEGCRRRSASRAKQKRKIKIKSGR